MYPLPGRGWEEPGPSGYTYAAVLLSVENGPEDRPGMLAALRELRFSGWLAPLVPGPSSAPGGSSGAGRSAVPGGSSGAGRSSEPGRSLSSRGGSGWLVAVAASGDGTVAAGRRGVLGVGEWLAERFAGPVLAVRVVDDRQLVLASWADGAEIGRYVSDPSWRLDDDEGVLSDPVGVEHADAFAGACGKPEVADDLAELLAEELDTDRFIESERLARVLRLLGLPGWLVTAASLPHDVVNGPPTRDLTRLGAGRPGLLGRVTGWAVTVIRRRRPPPPPLANPPRGSGAPDPWLL